MTIDLMEAIKAPFTKTKKMNIGHYLLGTILLIIPIVNLLMLGALVKFITYVRKGREEEFSIFDNMGENFSLGCKLFVGGLLLCIPLILIGVITALFSDGSAGSGMLVFALMAVIYLVYLVFGFGLLANFTLDYKVMSMVDFRRALFLIKGDVKSYIMVIVFTFVIAFLYSILTMIPLLGFIVALVLSVPYTMAIYHLAGQFLRDNKAVAVLNNVYHFDN